MEEFKYRDLCGMLTVLSLHSQEGSEDALDAGDQVTLSLLEKTAKDMKLDDVARLVKRVVAEFQDKTRTKQDLTDRLKAVTERVKDDLDKIKFMFIPPEDVKYCDETPLFGTDVADTFGERVITDIQEAGMCFATGRYTACVFHLMRVMEVGVQSLGTRLGVELAEEKEWGRILNKINDRIYKVLYPSNKQLSAEEKNERDTYAETVAYLTNVKNAWRNRTMHPKATYTREEAKKVFGFVEDFMQNLVPLVSPPESGEHST